MTRTIVEVGDAVKMVFFTRRAGKRRAHHPRRAAKGSRRRAPADRAAATVLVEGAMPLVDQPRHFEAVDGYGSGGGKSLEWLDNLIRHQEPW